MCCFFSAARTYLDILLGDVKIQVRDEEFRRRVVGRFIVRRRRSRCRRASTAGSSHDLIDCHADRSASSHHRFTSPTDRGFSNRIPPRFNRRDLLLRRCWFFLRQSSSLDFPVLFYSFFLRGTRSGGLLLRRLRGGFDERVERLIDVHDIYVIAREFNIIVSREIQFKENKKDCFWSKLSILIRSPIFFFLFFLFFLVSKKRKSRTKTKKLSCSKRKRTSEKKKKKRWKKRDAETTTLGKYFMRRV